MYFFLLHSSRNPSPGRSHHLALFPSYSGCFPGILPRPHVSSVTWHSLMFLTKSSFCGGMLRFGQACTMAFIVDTRLPDGCVSLAKALVVVRWVRSRLCLLHFGQFVSFHRVSVLGVSIVTSIPRTFWLWVLLSAFFFRYYSVCYNRHQFVLFIYFHYYFHVKYFICLCYFI